MARTELQLHIEGHSLPGRQCWTRNHVHIGVQRRSEVIDLVPGDATVAAFDLTAQVLTIDRSELDFRGLFVHGKRGDRFLYLSWVEMPPSGDPEMFARIKLFLGDIDQQLLINAVNSGHTLFGSLALSTVPGTQVSGGVRPPNVRWGLSGDTRG